MKKNIIIILLAVLLSISLVFNIFLLKNKSNGNQSSYNQDYTGEWTSDNYVLNINSDGTFLVYETEKKDDTSCIRNAFSGYIENGIMVYEKGYDYYTFSNDGDISHKELSLSDITLTPLSSVSTNNISLITSNVLETTGKKYSRKK